jgi:hypothetical protein
MVPPKALPFVVQNAEAADPALSNRPPLLICKKNVTYNIALKSTTYERVLCNKDTYSITLPQNSVTLPPRRELVRQKPHTLVNLKNHVTL